MEKRFPVLEVTKSALALPFNNILEVLKSIGFFVIATIALSLLVVVLTMIVGGDATEMQSAMDALNAGDPAGLAALGVVLIVFLLFLFGIFVISAHIFNYWVRFSALGKQFTSRASAGETIQAAAVNGIKFLVIGIISLIVSFVVSFILSAFGVSPGLAEQMAETDIIQATKDGMSNSIISTVIVCFIYSLFSANLTATALGDNREQLEHPHTLDFALSLVLIYAVLIIPTMIAVYLGSAVLLWIIQIVLGILVILAVAAAHGYRYRVCIAEIENGNGDGPQA